jgi:crotonobetaine/carnitine-CoA ligase
VYRSIPQLLADAAARDAEGSWLRTDDVRLTFAEAAAAVGGRAATLQEHGLARGDLVVLTARTTPQYLLAWLAVTSLGAIAVPTNPASSGAEFTGLLAQTRPRLIVTDTELRPLIESIDTASAGVLDVDGLASDVTDLRTDLAHSADIAGLIPTSGTTGRSKLVMQTHRAYVLAAEGFPFWMELTSADRLMTSLPLFHINAPAYSVLGSLACGAGLVLLPRFSASGFLDAARRHGATEFNAIGAMLEILMRQPERADDADNPLRLCYTGPAPERDRQLEMERRFGIRIVCGYAMSESPYGLIWPRGSRPFGTLGTVRQHPVLGVVNEARVVDDEGRDADEGELLLRSPAVTPGYWGMPEETAATITEDGWLRSGDLVTRDANEVYTFVARKKEVLRRRGENLSPTEVEEAIQSHPSVVECAVVGVESELSEEDIKAFVVIDGPADFGVLRAWAAQRLAPFKVPRYWQRVAALPRTPTQRVAKHLLPPRRAEDEYDAESAHPGYRGATP